MGPEDLRVLDESTREKLQSLVFTGFGSLPRTTVLRLDGIDKAWLGAVLPHVTFGRSKVPIAVQVLLTARGLAALDVPPETIRELGLVFQHGMTSESSSRRLGDKVSYPSEHWEWTDLDHDAMLLVYHSEDGLEPDLETALTGSARILGRKTLRRPEFDREHFGFLDGLSNVRLAKTDPPEADVVPDGEIVIGRENQTGLLDERGPLGVDGTFVVVRELDQDVRSHWAFWLEAAGGDPDEAVYLAAKAVGRWPNGMPIRTGQTREPAAVEADQEIRTFRDDPHGTGCPFGSHIRRANPRDTLVSDPEISEGISALHRIMRRGRVYGPPAPADFYPETLRDQVANGPPEQADEARGLMFICLCGNLRRQFEFLQQNWIKAPKFANLLNDVDPLFANETTSQSMCIPTDGFNRYVDGVGGWVSVRGGAYLLMPSKPVLERLASGATGG